ncbi:hypothetical protein F5Y07DRAFT_404453 [Xylaria sp. FL0933]|nr:hypothetical protein F5Y07DRAFT_404453 [Xylaria sp. FL0933]
MLSHIANDDSTFISYLINSLEKLDAPLVQVFIKPFSKSLLILSDYQEAHHMISTAPRNLITRHLQGTVAGTALYEKASAFLELWESKSSVADGRPWVAGEDINNVSLDAIIAFAFGRRFSEAPFS